ncbi:MAG: 3-hydroxybutyrate dehydrogenase [Pseudomonadota bacterium]
MSQPRVAVVTGSTSGIGLAIARALAARGDTVVLNGFGEPAAIAALVAELGAGGARIEHDPADMSEPDQIARLVREVEARHGRIDILVANAGIQHTARVEDFPPERWDAILAVNLSAAFHLARAALPGMQARGHGRIVNIASVHGLVASVDKSAYVAAKHGLVGLTKVIALENAERGITCNAICPGWVHTPLVEKQIVARAERQGLSMDDAQRGLLAEKEPTLRFTAPEDIAEAVLFLCGPAGANITGTTLALDGGWTAR